MLTHHPCLSTDGGSTTGRCGGAAPACVQPLLGGSQAGVWGPPVVLRQPSDIGRIADLLFELNRPGAALVAAPQQPGDMAGRWIVFIAVILAALVDLVAGEVADHAAD